MKVLASHKFKNDKELQVVYLNPTDQKRLHVPECDVYGLVRIDEGDQRATYYRPDEAMLLIRLLSEALYKSVQCYEIGLRRE